MGSGPGTGNERRVRTRGGRVVLGGRSEARRKGRAGLWGSHMLGKIGFGQKVGR